MTAAQKTVHIRNARPDEMDAVLDLTLAAYEEFDTSMPAINARHLKANVIRTLSQPGKAEVIVAELGLDLVGSVLLYPAEGDAYGGWVEEARWPELRLLAVKPSARGRGIGTLLMEECIGRAQRAGADALGLRTGDSMVVALPMYERRGFVRLPSRDIEVEGGEKVKAYILDLTSD